MAAYQNPADAAQPYFSQIPSTITPYFQPYINAGQQALSSLGGQYKNLLGNYGNLQGTYGQMATDPAAVMGHVASGYQESPGYQFQMQQGMGAEANRADAGGYAGTPQDQQQSAYIAEQLANQDFYNYLSHALGIGKAGLEGEQGLYNEGLHGAEGINKMGYGASSDLASGLAQALTQQGNLAYAGAANQDQHRGGIIGDTLGLIGGVVGDIFGAPKKPSK